MPDVPLPPDEVVGPAGLALLATRPPVNVYRMAAWSPALLGPFMQMTHAMFRDCTLGDRLREAVILRVAGHERSAYEAHHHRALAARAGLHEAQIEALVTLAEVPEADETLRSALAFTDATMHGEPDEALRDALVAALGNRGVVELGLLIGFYRMVAVFLRATGVPLDTHTSVELSTGGADVPTSTHRGLER